MVLAIGLLVDDAIVVVENVERVMAEEDMTPKEATLYSMREITSALMGIALVLAAVFIPMAFWRFRGYYLPSVHHNNRGGNDALRAGGINIDADPLCSFAEKEQPKKGPFYLF